MSQEYISPARHEELIRSCIGARLLSITPISWGDAEMVFDNGVTLEFSDAYCYSKFGEETGCGVLHESEPTTDAV